MPPPCEMACATACAVALAVPPPWVAAEAMAEAAALALPCGVTGQRDTQQYKEQWPLNQVKA